VEFTFTYIKVLINQMGFTWGTNLNYIKQLMLHYVEINAITLDELQKSKLTFEEYIKQCIFQ
jgi:hypothetical protein